MAPQDEGDCSHRNAERIIPAIAGRPLHPSPVEEPGEGSGGESVDPGCVPGVSSVSCYAVSSSSIHSSIPKKFDMASSSAAVNVSSADVEDSTIGAATGVSTVREFND